jgi:SAM-dependent methyltransferase
MVPMTTPRDPSWWLDEMAHAGPEHLDEAYAATYDRKAGFDPTPDIDVLVGHGLSQDSTVVDLGAGTGAFALAAARRARAVIAVDVSPAMVGVLRAAATDRSNITVVQAGLLSYEHAGPPADFVYSRNVFHHLPDFWKGMALERVRALLAPGGIFRVHDLVYDFGPADALDAIPAWMAGGVSDPRLGWTPDELAEHARTEHSTWSWVFDGLLERAGFEILDRSYGRGVYGAYTCRRL